MIGFLVGTACLIGLVKVLRRGHCGGGHGWAACGPRGFYGGPFAGGCGPRFGGPFGPPPWRRGHHGFREGHFGKKMALRFLFEHLDTTPGQEKVILSAIDEVREAGRNARSEAKKARAEVAKAVGGESFDTSSMAAASARIEAAMATVRDAMTGALLKIHDALDERQRRLLSELIEDGPAFFHRFGGPYRGGWGGGEEV